MRLNGSLAAVLASAVSAAVAGTAFMQPDSSEEEKPEPTRSQAHVLSQEFDLPLVLPETLPGSFRWADQIAVGADENHPGHASYRIVMFHDPRSGESVRVCMARTVAPCMPREGADIRKHDDLALVLQFGSDTSDRAVSAWETTVFTSDLDRVEWLS